MTDFCPGTFQRLMEQVLHGLNWKTLLIHLDDVIVISPNFDNHLQRLEKLFRRWQDTGLKLKSTKCKTLQDKIQNFVAYYSKTLALPERNYCVTHRELLAVVKAGKHFCIYLYSTKFQLHTDYAFLRWLCRRHKPSVQVAHLLKILSSFSYYLKHRAGKLHGNADGVRRQATCL